MSEALSPEDEAHDARAKSAWEARKRWQGTLDEAWDYVAPHRKSTRQSEGGPEGRTDRLFDNHAMTALHRSVGKLMEDVFPSGAPFVALEPGPLVTDEEERAKTRGELELRSNVMRVAFQNGDFDNAVAGCFTDGLISTGYMTMLKGPRSRPVVWVNIPHDEMAHDLGPYDEPWGFFWKRQWSYRQIMAAFPKGQFSDAFREKAKKPEEKVDFCQDVTFDPEANVWRFRCYVADKCGEVIAREAYKTCPIVCFRYFRLPGEPYGFGPVLLNLPTIKTLNKTTELALMGAALNALGIYTRIDDGVFNPDTARIAPGAFWTVARNGGNIGPSIARLPNSTDPNLNMLTIQDLRQSISAGMNDEQLPPESGTPRSASEIIERTRRLRQNHAGAFSRIVNDVILAMLPRVQEILVDHGILKDAVDVDHLLVTMKVVSPLGAAFRARQAENLVEWAQIVGAVFGPDVLRAATPVEKTAVDIGLDMGLPQSRLYSPTDQDAMANRIKEAVALAMEQQQKAAAPPPPPNGDPAQGMMAA